MLGEALLRVRPRVAADVPVVRLGDLVVALAEDALLFGFHVAELRELVRKQVSPILPLDHRVVDDVPHLVNEIVRGQRAGVAVDEDARLQARK